MSIEEVKARMHNGGPQALKATGKKKENLDRFWGAVKEVLERIKGGRSFIREPYCD